MTMFSPAQVGLCRFDRCLNFVLDVSEPDNETTRIGITQAEYDAWQAHHGLPRQEIRNIDRDAVVDIYRGAYWHRCECEELPEALALILFDTAAERHNAQMAVEWLQRILVVAVTGVVDHRTLLAVRTRLMTGRIDRDIACYIQARHAHYAALVSRYPETALPLVPYWENRMRRLEEEIKQ